MKKPVEVSRYLGVFDIVMDCIKDVEFALRLNYFYKIK
jgi:hypothetical protein